MKRNVNITDQGHIQGIQPLTRPYNMQEQSLMAVPLSDPRDHWF